MSRPSEEPEIEVWRVPAVPGLTLKRIARMQRARSTYSEDYALVALQAGAYESWYRGELRTHDAGEVRLKQPGHVTRGSRVLAPVTMQIAAFAPIVFEQAATAMGRPSSPGSGTGCLLPGSRGARLSLAMHAALARGDATDLELGTLVAETLAEVVSESSREGGARIAEAPRAIRRAREYLHEAFDSKVTLDAVAAHADLDKYHLVRAFRREVGLPPYEYLTHLRVARASRLLGRGVAPCEVAQAVGLYDESQLCRHFRRIMGMTPGRYALAMGSSSRQHHPRRATTAEAGSRP
ncbi:MAG: helix-turn-helix transcriptional regulator [Myxococcales bacterium]|nr:helix-turn-helix transcriptional regulator [Myxococcales bacterium]